LIVKKAIKLHNSQKWSNRFYQRNFFKKVR